ncbi:MAG: substrate-binding domain-containing protein, partial [Flavobacteriaceae bacterium]|nr:substrate-binding domain-containing protein [Flavobacteriaceae bacterium]
MFNHPIKCVLLLFLVSFLACKSNKNSHKINIAFSQGLGSHPLRTAMNHSMEIQASLHEDVNLAIYKAENNIKKQIEDIQKSIDFNADVIIVSPIDPDSISPIIEKAYEKGIPIIILDRKINSEKYTSYIGADNLKVGNQAGDYIASFAKQPINVVEIKGEDTSFPTQERSKGFHQVVDGLANINLMQSFKGLPEEEFKTLLDSVGNNINFIFAFNDDLASQAWEMARRVGVENNIKFIGADGLNGESGGIEMVLNGKLAATILYPPGGAEAIETAVKIYNNEPVARRIVLGTTVIDRFNADIMKNQFDKINEQQATIENQVSAIKKQEQLYYSQNNLLKLSIAILAVILGLAIYSVYLIFTIRKKNRQLTLTNEKITVQRNQIEKIANEVKESNEAKLNFFTGLSHEFKTPITLILSSIESLKESYANKVVKLPYEIELVNKNSNRLLRLINNLLDFRKIEDKMFNMRASKTNVYNFTFGIYRDFESEAKRRSIDFKISTNNK